MYYFRTNAPFTSKRYPGVTATINALTVGLRSRLDMAIAENPDREAYYDLLQERDDVKGDDKKSRLKRMGLNERIMVMERRQSIGPTVRECVASVEGLALDGQPATVETLATRGPDDLLQEIVDFINFDMRLSADETRDFTSASGSTEPEAGATPSTTAQPASEAAGIELVTAGSSQSVAA